MKLCRKKSLQAATRTRSVPKIGSLMLLLTIALEAPLLQAGALLDEVFEVKGFVPEKEDILFLTFDETYPQPDNESLTIKNFVTLLKEPFSLADSYEPIDPKHKEIDLYFGVHFSSLEPKRAEGDSCPHYQEQLTLVTGSKVPEAGIFASSFSMAAFHYSYFNRFSFDTDEGVFKHWLTASNPFGEQEIETTSGSFSSHPVTSLPSNLAIKTFSRAETKLRLTLVFGAYDGESKARAELHSVGVAIGFLEQDGKKFLLKGFGGDGNDKDRWQLAAYDYDRRYLESKFVSSYTLSYQAGSWFLKHHG